ncbi:hypothetical protein [Marinococcus halotolerans]|uniref:hypothetical protein n=1 Tax=Marinococcus halotolerans TaxID=301092 RepID=UPI0003B49DB0|nr:hypothetical protein [Marinococcus halotolerans]
MAVSLKSYKIQKAVRRLSKELHQDLEGALMHQEKVFLSMGHHERRRIEPHLQLLQEAGAAYFWEVTDQLAISKEEVLYVGIAADGFNNHIDKTQLCENA